MIEMDLPTDDGRTLHCYDTGAGLSGDAERLVVFWHHGTPNTGAPPQPLFAESERLGVRWVSYDRPGYGGSSPLPDRDVASVADDVTTIIDALGIDRLATMGHSGGGPRALATAALLPDRVRAVVSISGIAPYDARGLDWYAGMADGSAASLRAAAGGRAAKERHEASGDEGDIGFIAADEAALGGEWAWFLDVVRPGVASGPAPLIDDDLSAVTPWGFDPATITAPTLFVAGGRDAMVPSSHSEWLAHRIRSSELWVEADDGHVSVMHRAPAALVWLVDATAGR
ncbi:alpha/beta fold hydrolase [Lapillicoccus sp.]|uniref:alpha/beta fold hydrolase n=1 Tax=Lapillicoccus sp. TaxID=1909287 RepID=UPI0025E96A07|nr:alpha/beta fold hydrolase [Lapillicoccus sp.]